MTLTAHIRRISAAVIVAIPLLSGIACSTDNQSMQHDMNHRQTIRAYYQAFRNRDRAALEDILVRDLVHTSSFATYTDRDSMLDEIWPMVGQTWAEELQIFGSHPEFMVRYRVAGGERPSQTMSEYMRFEDDQIAEIEVFMGRELKSPTESPAE